MENNRVLVFIGAFLFGFSIVLIVLASLFVHQIDSSTVGKTSGTYFEAFLGWIGATIIGGGIALKYYMDNSGSGGMGYGMGGEEDGDSAVAFVFGLSIALFALLATWLWIIGVPYSVLALTLLSSGCSFVGLVMIAYFAYQGE